MKEAALEEMGLLPVWKARSATRIEKPAEQAGLPMDWNALRAAIEGCTGCALSAHRKKVVVGAGNPSAPWLFVGEAPGAEEDMQGEPFVGQAGKLLDNMLAAIGLSRQRNAYIANTVKCRPPGNRNPEPSEMAACRPYLVRQIELVEPKLIVVMGRVAAQSVLDTDASISSLRGRAHAFKSIPVIVTYHPAYLLRNLSDKAKAWEDLCLAARTMESIK